MLAGSLNLPAHTFYPSRHTIAKTLLASGADTCVVYCNSSRGRGPRVAGWLRDAVKEVAAAASAGSSTKTPPDVVVLEGGAKGFAHEYGSDGELVIQLPDEVRDS